MEEFKSKFKISVITPTFNSEKYLPELIESLINQTYKDFEWIVCDGGSVDNTLGILNSQNKLNIKIISKKDFGIYDAINNGIRESNSEYYVMIGSDDIFYETAIENYVNSFESGVDIVTAPIKIGNRLVKARPSSWLNSGQSSYISGFSIGACIRKSLHLKYGLFSKKYPIAADQYFILKACKSGAVVKKIDSTAGIFRLTGVSSLDTIGCISEFYRVQLAVGENKLLQTLIFILRLIKNYRKL